MRKLDFGERCNACGDVHVGRYQIVAPAGEILAIAVGYAADGWIGATTLALVAIVVVTIAPLAYWRIKKHLGRE